LPKTGYYISYTTNNREFSDILWYSIITPCEEVIFMKKHCYIVGAGETDDSAVFEPDSYIIAADGGYALLERRGITPDLIIGDFDSLGWVPQSGEVLRLPVEKDDTDLAVALREAFSRGYSSITVYGALGGRLDHTLANLQLIAAAASEGKEVYLVGGGYTVTALCGGSLHFAEGGSGYISVFAHGGDAEGVYERGLKYPLDNATLTCRVPLGVSNEFTGAAASVSVSRGTLIIMWQGGSIPLRNLD
jgi:thiamine pyrophosphokinase